jgi:hypothetical protein
VAKRTKSAESNFTVPKLVQYVDLIIDDDVLNEAFYHSLFDYNAVFENPYFPSELLNQQRDELKDLVCEICGDNELKTNEAAYQQFENTIISTDIFCKIVLTKQLSKLGFVVQPVFKKYKYDLFVPAKSVHIELKRIIGWGDYAIYFDTFYGKTNRLDNYVYAVLTTHPPKIQEIILRLQANDAESETNDAEMLHDHIRRIITAHYVMEKLLRRQEAKKIEFAVAFVDKNNKNDKDNLANVGKQIEEKISTFGDADRRWFRWMNIIYQKIRR